MPRATIYLDDATQARLDAYQPGERELSALLRRLLARYAAIVDAAAPRLTVEEWSMVWNANSGIGPLVEDAPERARALLWANIHDAGHPELAATVRGLARAQQLALLDVIERLDADERSVAECVTEWGLVATEPVED